MIETILGIVSAVGTVANTGSAIIDLIGKVKKHLGEEDSQKAFSQPTSFSQQIPNNLPQMSTFHPQMVNSYGNGNQWLSDLQAIARQNGNGMVPSTIQPLLGINLTGVWIPPSNYYDQTFIRQYGPYINLVAVVAGNPTLFAEGLFDPIHRVIHVVGRNINGATVEARGQLFPNWTLQGWLMMLDAFGQPIQVPYCIAKVA